MTPEERTALEARIRTALGYGAVNAGVTPLLDFSTMPGFVLDNIDEGPETFSSTPVASGGGHVTLSVADATGFATHVYLHVDVAERLERVVTQFVAGTDITVVLTKQHEGTYPVVVESGLARVRWLLWEIERLNNLLATNQKTVGLKSVDKNDVVFMDPGPLDATRDELKQRLAELAGVLRIPWSYAQAGTSSLSAYVA